MTGASENLIERVEGCLRRIEQFDPQVHAWVLVDASGARQQAELLARELEQGHSRGPLHGVPIGIKDIVDVAGWPTLAGSGLRAGHVAKHDAALVARLRQAGAILLGKTVTTEFACFEPPPTRNPWNFAHTPGGSSSGSAAAVAAGMCVAAIGSQTGGSITRPASYCGVAGLKPTRGLISCDGVVPVSFHLDHPGPIARRVADLATMLSVLAQPQGVTRVAPSQAPDYAAQLDWGHAPRLGLIEDYFLTECDPVLCDAVRAAFEKLSQAGARIEARSLPPGFEHVHRMHRRIMLAEAAEAHRETFPSQRSGYSDSLARLLDEGRGVSMFEYVEALRRREAFYHALGGLFDGIDALILPATTCTPPADLTTTGDAAFNAPWSYAGVPVVSLPCGLVADGMPAAVQLVGPTLSEATLLASGAWCERVFEFSAMPPLNVPPEPVRNRGGG